MSTQLTPKPMNPVQEALSLREMMDRLLENAFVSPRRWLTEWSAEVGFATPAVDMLEDKDEFVINAALPGWKPEDVEITYEPGMVTLKGEISAKEEEKDEKKKVYRREIRHTSFVRSIDLPTEVMPDKAKAEFRNGILTIKLPKAEEVKPKQIKIDVK